MTQPNEYVRYLYDPFKYKLKYGKNTGIPFFQAERNHRAIFISKFDKDKKFIKLGYSLCNKKDEFNKKRGLLIARGRCDSTIKYEDVPNSIKHQFRTFAENEKNYWSKKYKGAGLWNFKI